MTKLSIPDMSCGHCKASVEAALAPMAQQISVDLAAREVTLIGVANTELILTALKNIGFDAEILAN